MQGSTAISPSQLDADLRGRVIVPGDEAYDEARSVFYGGIDRRPAVIVRPVDASEVAYVVSLARDTGLELAVRSGGHSVAGHSVSEGGIVLDLADMRGLDIDVEGRTAWAQTGLTAAEYSVATADVNLATGFGDAGSVGIGGITLGGGVGYLGRKHGLTIDDLLAAEIVTADGQVLQVDAENHPDLFWAIRGGGGNFGVATRFRYRVHELGTILGGMLVLPATADVIESFIAESEGGPEELSTIANVMTAPPMPFLPEEYHGRPVIMAMIVYAGPAETGERVIAPLRAMNPIVDMVKPIAYPEIYPPEEPGYHPIAIARTMFIESVDRETAEMILDRLEASTAMMGVTQLRVLGGAMARVLADATAYAHRDRGIMANVAALYERPEEAAEHEAWVVELTDSLREEGDSAGYVNFLGDEGEERIRAAYPGSTWDRLAAIKARYDPDNLFRLNQNIPPAVEPAG